MPTQITSTRNPRIVDARGMRQRSSTGCGVTGCDLWAQVMSVLNSRPGPICRSLAKRIH